MNSELPSDVEEFGRVAARRLQRVGGVAAAMAAESNPDVRTDAAGALADLGADDLDPRGDADDLLAAAVLCRVAGAVILPYPVVESILATEGRFLAVVDPSAPRINHGDLPVEWLATDLDGVTYDVSVADRASAKLGPFLVRAELQWRDQSIDPRDLDLHLIMGAWYVLGSVETALAQATAHVRERVQFGMRLADFQAVRFTLADTAVSVRGLEELAKFTAARFHTSDPDNRACDALALRLHAVDTARAVLKTAHQLFGASGFCDETDISVIDRHLQAMLRHPASGDALARRLARAVGAGRLDDLFAEHP